jgi:hypothetical protein
MFVFSWLSLIHGPQARQPGVRIIPAKRNEAEVNKILRRTNYQPSIVNYQLFPGEAAANMVIQ